MSAIKIKASDSLCDYFARRAKIEQEKTLMLTRKASGAWQEHSWQEIARRAAACCDYLKKQKVSKGEKVLMLCPNSPEWLIGELAVLALGAILVPAYISYRDQDLDYVARHQKCRVCLSAGGAMTNRHLTHKLKIIDIAKASTLSSGAKSSTKELSPVKSDPNDTALIIFTSATSGQPKAVKLSHLNILSNVSSALDTIAQSPLARRQHRFLSFLPLAHSYEHLGGLWFPIGLGASIAYPRSLETLLDDIGSSSPTLITVVPRFLDTVRRRIIARATSSTGIRGALLRAAVDYAESKPLGARRILLLGLPVVKRGLSKMLGGNNPHLISGGAPMNIAHELFFSRLGVSLSQGYGLTEAAPLISVYLPGKERSGTVGPPVPGVEIKLAQDGELLVKGKNIMLGYDQEPEITAQVLRNGWLSTGDLAHIDKEGFITITERKKDLIVNDNGENIAPSAIEARLELEPEIAQVMVYGDAKAFLSAVIVPENKDQQTTFSDQEITKAISRANADLRRYEKIRKFCRAKEIFTIENGFLTPTMKLKRHAIIALYKDKLESFYKN